MVWKFGCGWVLGMICRLLTLCVSFSVVVLGVGDACDVLE